MGRISAARPSCERVADAGAIDSDMKILRSVIAVVCSSCFFAGQTLAFTAGHYKKHVVRQCLRRLGEFRTLGLHARAKQSLRLKPAV